MKKDFKMHYREIAKSNDLVSVKQKGCKVIVNESFEYSYGDSRIARAVAKKLRSLIIR